PHLAPARRGEPRGVGAAAGLPSPGSRSDVRALLRPGHPDRVPRREDAARGLRGVLVPRRAARCDEVRGSAGDERQPAALKATPAHQAAPPPFTFRRAGSFTCTAYAGAVYSSRLPF